MFVHIIISRDVIYMHFILLNINIVVSFFFCVLFLVMLQFYFVYAKTKYVKIKYKSDPSVISEHTWC